MTQMAIKRTMPRTIILVAVVSLLPSATLFAAWSQWQYTGLPGIKYREQYDSACGGPKSRARYHYHQFQNDGPSPRKFKSVFNYINSEGQAETTDDLEELRAGELEQPSGTWRCAVPGSIRMTVKDGWD